LISASRLIRSFSQHREHTDAFANRLNFPWELGSMKVDGTCHCGRIAFEAEIDPSGVNICHCSDCQRLTGTAFRTSVGATAENFRILRGSPREYIKTADSGTRRVQGFCIDCGTPIFATSASDRTAYGLRVGCLTQRAELSPSKQIWRCSALPWVPAMEKLETWDAEDH
jgi:hypothetical protein